MSRLAAVLLLLASFPGTATLAAQSPAEVVTAIRARYGELQSLIAAGGAGLWRDAVASNTGGVPSPGTGAVRRWLALYSRPAYPLDGTIGLQLVLAKAENTTELSGTVFYEEYLFAPDGQLEFYYRKRCFGDGERAKLLPPESEERFYFAGSRLVRTLIDGVQSDAPDDADRRRGAAIRAKALSVAALASLRASIPSAAADPE